ncbi:hypothetical protein J6590_020608 [Homalodisca vitripennis]|nr:hypothetical protein J6590_020608 [Homalodisca vitripennis]
MFSADIKDNNYGKKHYSAANCNPSTPSLSPHRRAVLPPPFILSCFTSDRYEKNDESIVPANLVLIDCGSGRPGVRGTPQRTPCLNYRSLNFCRCAT